MMRASFSSRVQGIALVLRETPAGVAVLPRRVALALEPGEGALHVEGPPMDGACRASFENAWRAARGLAGEPRVDARLRVTGEAPLAGGSAGLLVALLALSALQGRPAPRCFATGEVADERGRLEGGARTRVKAEAAASLARDLAWPSPLFLSPPVEPVPEVPGVRVLCVADVRAGWALVAGEA